MSTELSAAREWWASLTQTECDERILRIWPSLPEPEYSETVKAAFRAWIERRVYIDNGGNYRLRPEPATPTHSPSGKIAAWNREVKRLFPSSMEFHRAAVKFCNATSTKEA